MDTRNFMLACAAIIMSLWAQVHAETVIPMQGQTPQQIQQEQAQQQATQQQQQAAQQQAASQQQLDLFKKGLPPVSSRRATRSSKELQAC